MAETPRIYLDSCAINRLTDDLEQERVALEAQAMQFIFQEFSRGRSLWIARSIVETELRNNPQIVRRLEALALLHFAAEFHYPEYRDCQRAITLRTLGYEDFDAMHLALAESAGADFLLTTDDRFLRRARRGVGAPLIKVVNPLDYLREVTP